MSSQCQELLYILGNRRIGYHYFIYLNIKKIWWKSNKFINNQFLFIFDFYKLINFIY